ncbi:MAG: pilus assembly protein [SAR202 cluster bacterium]|nr:pilus assembly protein [SAR202 cluster bacterium]
MAKGRHRVKEWAGRRALLRREGGQAAFEFLMALPFFILVILLMVDMGLLTYQYVSVSNAAREGARHGAVNCGGAACSEDEVRTMTLDRSGGILTDASEIAVGWMDATGDGVSSGRGDSVVVSINHPYNFLFFPASIPVYACADMRLEQANGAAGLPAGSAC